MRKKIAILGSTGSIGTSVLQIIEKYPEKFEICALSCYQNTTLLKEQIKKFAPASACIVRQDLAKQLQSKQKNGLKIFENTLGINQMLEVCKADLVVCAISGYEGIYSVIKAINLKIPVAIANKEPLVVAGKIIIAEAKKNKTPIYPIDSEHNAIFQCLLKNSRKQINNIILTASGGPFLNTPKQNFSKISLAQVLKHPKWKMGGKNTVDSASMMNKALEIIEAKWLFGIDLNKIQVLIHPQSIVHGLVQFCDGSTIAQMGLPDMKIAISYCLGQTNRIDSGVSNLDLTTTKLEFFKLDKDKFLALDYIKECNNFGDGFVAAFNGANEWLVKNLLNEKINFFQLLLGLDLWMKRVRIVRTTKNCPSFLKTTNNLEDALAANQWGITSISKLRI